MEDLPRIPPSDARVIFIQIIISINIAITMKFTNGKLHHPQHNDDDDNPEDTPTGKSSEGILGVCLSEDDGDDSVGMVNIIIRMMRYSMLTDDRILKQQPDFFPMSAQGDPRDWPATTLKRDPQFQSKTCVQFLPTSSIWE